MKRRFSAFFISALLMTACVPVKERQETADPGKPFPAIPRMTKEELLSKIGRPDIIILDCRLDEQWAESDKKIPGAVHKNPLDVDSWAHEYPKETAFIVTY